MNPYIASIRFARWGLPRAGLFFWALLGLLALLAASGCSFAPKYKTPDVQKPAVFKENAGWKVAEPSDDAIHGTWWELFRDAELSKFEQQVAPSNQTVAAAYANFLAARAIIKEARAQYFPNVTLNPSVVKAHQPTSSGGQSVSTSTGRGSGTLYSAPLEATWDLDFWGATRNTVKADTYLAQESAANLANLRLTAQANLAVAYYQLRGQDELKRVLDETVIADENFYNLTKILFETGIDSEEDVSASQTQLATAQAQATSLGILRAQYEHAIATLLGQPASTFSIAPQPFNTNVPAIPLTVPSRLLERRPDIAAAERAVAAANSQIGVARAAYFPTITLSGTAGYESTSIGNLISGPNAFWSVGAAAAQSVFDAGLRRAAVAQFKAQYESTVANYREGVLTAFQQVEDNLAALRILEKERAQQDVAVQGALKTYLISTNRYHLGIDSYLNVLTAQTTLLNNEQTAVNLQVQQMTASVQLITALGGGWETSQLPTAKQINDKEAQNTNAANQQASVNRPPASARGP